MQIKIKLFASFRIGRFKSEVRQYAVGTTVGMIFQELGISMDGHYIVLVNGRPENMDRPLVNGDVLSLLPLVAGG